MALKGLTTPPKLSRLSMLIVVIIALPSLTGCRVNPAPTMGPDKSPVPAEYVTMSREISGSLSAFSASLDRLSEPAPHMVTFAAELLPANGNAAPNFLRPQTLESVRMYLDALKAMGVQGCKVQMAYPILAKDYPDSSEYLEFYKAVVTEMRKRDLKVLAAVQNLFQGTEFSDLTLPSSMATPEAYDRIKREIVETVIHKLRPDYLTFANEPTTTEALTGIRQTVSSYTKHVQFVLNGLDRQGVLIGAGAGSWNDLAFIQSLVRDTTLDYIDIHIYPVSFLDEAMKMAEIVRAGNKRVIIGEAWSYKVSQSELGDLSGMAMQSTVFGRDVYSFWSPLDSQYIETIVKFIEKRNIEFVSFFWSRYFFGYVDYASTPKDLDYGQLSRLANQAAVRGIQSKTVTGAGETYRRLIASAVATK
jgi:hypothetical protein